MLDGSFFTFILFFFINLIVQFFTGGLDEIFTMM